MRADERAVRDGTLSGRMLGPFGILTRLEYWGFRIVAALFGALPVDVASSLSGWIWRTVAPHLRRHARAERNLAASMPELSARERAAVLDQMWDGLGRTFAEAFHLRTIQSDPSRIALDLSPEVLEAVRSPRGCVLACPHMGNWEVASIAALQAGGRVAGVYQRLKNPLVDRYVTGLREPYYPQGLFTKGNDAVLKLRRVLRQGHGVALLADLREMRGVAVPFFGRPAPSTPFPAFLACSMGAPLVAGRVVRLGGARFRITGELLPVQSTGNRDADIEATTAAIHACFERFIRENPGQWMWAHRRWG